VVLERPNGIHSHSWKQVARHQPLKAVLNTNIVTVTFWLKLLRCDANLSSMSKKVECVNVALKLEAIVRIWFESRYTNASTNIGMVKLVVDSKFEL
jgi:hypothetical protein